MTASDSSCLRAVVGGIVAAAAGVVALSALAWAAEVPTTVPLVNPVSERGAAGLFNSLLTAVGAEIDPGRAGFHMVRPIGVTDTFPSDVPEIYVVVELKQSAFDMFRLIARFILEDPEGKPVGTLLHTDKAHFEFSDTGGYLTMRQPPGGFPPGRYRVEIHYGEEVNALSFMTLVRFTVIPAAGAVRQAP